MRRMRGLSARLLIAIGVLVALHLAVFGTLLVTLDGVQDADDEARDLARTTLATQEVRIALAELEAAERRVVVAGAEPAALAAWQGAAATARTSASMLGRDGGPAGRQLAARVRAYVLEVSEPLVRAARTRPLDARVLIAGGAGERRADVVERRLDRAVERQRAARQARRDRASELAGIAQAVGTVGVIGSILCALMLIAYVRRAILTPLGGVAQAARALAGGDLRARVRGHAGTGEVGELARTFDRMAASLEESRTVLERQNAELAEQSIELVEAVRSAREGASVLRAVLDATPDAIALLDREGKVLVDNPPMDALRRELGGEATAIDRHGALVPLDDRDVAAEHRDDVTLLGTRRSFARYAAPVHDGRGRLIGRLLVLRETTAEREAEHAKEDFFALVSHELRTPLTAILGYVELVLGDDGETLPAEHARHLAVVERNAQRLLRLVGDLLFAAQIERGSLLLEPGTVDLPQLVRDAVALARPRADEADIALTVEAAPIEPCLGDRDRLAQVLDNLISNALKFTPPGGRVAVRLDVRDERARLRVQDTGVGIPPEDLPKLFDRFYRATNATAGAVPGLGLGLMIVRAIVEGHDGAIAVESEVDRGTTFVAELPLRAVPDAPARPRATGYAAGGR